MGKSFNLERRLKRGVVKRAINNVSSMIITRRQQLRCYAKYLSDPFEAPQVYNYQTIYFYGPRYVVELKKLIRIRTDLWKYYHTL